jgi:type I restriction enzyme R subunit
VNINYPQYKGAFARVIDFQVEYAQSLIDDFSNLAKSPQIAISVDMLDTGIDIPEVLNLVFFKLVRSKTKFWQMVGRGTRLCPNLFGPNKNKEFFYVFDYCQNLEFFSQNPETTDGAGGEALGKRLFKARVELISALDTDKNARGEQEKEADLRQETAEVLRSQVAAMNLNNFIVRPKRRLVEQYSDASAWEDFNLSKQVELIENVAGLPSELTDEDQDAKQFDFLILRLQLAVLQHERSFDRLRTNVVEIASCLGKLQKRLSTVSSKGKHRQPIKLSL